MPKPMEFHTVLVLANAEEYRSIWLNLCQITVAAELIYHSVLRPASRFGQEM